MAAEDTNPVLFARCFGGSRLREAAMFAMKSGEDDETMAK